jgi:predicted site-specific integrase-resolvase
MYTISQLGAPFGLSRSTLLYYHSLGLLAPSARSPAGYRLYSERVRELLHREGSPRTPILFQRLLAINSQIDALRSQQHAILDMVEAEGVLKGAGRGLARHRELGRQTGVTEGNYRTVHGIFERVAPREHRRLLKFLGFSEAHIRALIKEST